QGKLGDTGAQGVQGKLGDTGAQGVQGKLGLTGEQGVQGKLGDTGTQGVQGKLGDTGAQGVQGKLGDTGAQGVQGKIGLTGEQGVQGKLGDTGAQGVQGKIGPQGETGGDGTSLLCFSTDQTIGTQGKYMGLGQQGGSHDEVSVITPFPAGYVITKFIVKVSQGNIPVNGEAWLLHDDHVNESRDGHQISDICPLTKNDPGPFASVCKLDGPFYESLQVWDSLSVFVKTDGGNFTGATACVLIGPAE
ncbi:MAG: collagen-like protein, partial [Proteobacteria bacterium]|nr:collagen-like protein [Pseudomonadota bacterium]